MLIGFDFFMGNCFDSAINASQIYRTDIENCKCDMIKIDTGSSVTYNQNKTSWGLNTIALCDFKDTNYEAGNVSLSGGQIQYLRIKKRKTGDLIWNQYVQIPFNSNQTSYQWSDFFVESLNSYDYSIVPYGGSVEGQYSINTITSSYQDIWILGGLGVNQQQFHLQSNIQFGDWTNQGTESIIQTLGSQYPFIIQNGMVNYRQGSFKGVLVSDDTLNSNSGIVDLSEKQLRQNFYNFLTNKQPKIFKDGNGEYALIAIKPSTIKFTPDNNLSRRLYNVSFDVVEIGDPNSISDLQNNGLVAIPTS